MNGHLDGARMADDSSRGRVVARPSSIQDEDVGPKSGGSQHRRTDRRRRTTAGSAGASGLVWRQRARATQPDVLCPTTALLCTLPQYLPCPLRSFAITCAALRTKLQPLVAEHLCARRTHASR